MDAVNPYSAPRTLAAGRGERQGVTVLLIASALVFCCLVVALGSIFVWAVKYRLEHTDFLGRQLIPPPMRLEIIDGLMLGCLVFGSTAAVLSVLIGSAALQRLMQSKVDQ